MFHGSCIIVGAFDILLRKVARKRRVIGKWDWAKRFRPTFLLWFIWMMRSFDITEMDKR
jgi:hypothetical protein